MLRDPINVINSEVNEIIGNPKDFKDIKQKYSSVLAEYASCYEKIPAKVCPELGAQHRIVQEQVQAQENPE